MTKLQMNEYEIFLQHGALASPIFAIHFETSSFTSTNNVLKH